MSLEHEKLLNYDKPVPAWNLITEHIKPGSTILVPGPSGSIIMDPTLFALAKFMHGKDGRILVCDPKSTKSPPQRIPHTDTMSAGNIDEYLKELSWLSKKGMRLAPVTWLGSESSIQNNGVKRSSVDVIIDHNLTNILTKYGYHSNQLYSNMFERIAAECSRVLKPNGSWLLMSEWPEKSINWQHTNVLKSVLKKHYLSLKPQQIDDCAQIELTEDEMAIMDKFTHSYKRISRTFQFDQESQSVLFRFADYCFPCHRVDIATKTIAFPSTY